MQNKIITTFVYMSNNINCSIVNEDILQKNTKALFNIPTPRLELVSPYPLFNQFQLNMRRKTEILQYDNFRQNTKTNNMTKKERYAYLATNRNSSNISQNGISQQSQTLACIENRTKPTLTTACDVPGKPIILEYDPTVPLYNYNESRTYAIVDNTKDILYVQYTKNIVEYLTTELDYVQPDVSMSYQTFTAQLGSLITNNSLSNSINYFRLKTPLAIWFNGSINSGYDQYGNKIVKPAAGINDFINFHIRTLSFQIYYNNTLVNPLQTPTITYSPSPLADCSFNLANVKDVFYGVQYIGMLSIDNLVLSTPPDTVYSFQIVVTYTYDNIIAYKLDYLKTGIYSNLLTRLDPDYTFNCVFNSLPPDNFQNATFNQFPTG